MITPQHIHKTTTVAALILWIGVIIYAWARPIAEAFYGLLFFGSIILIYLLVEAENSLKNNKQLDLVILSLCAVVAIVTVGYIAINFQTLHVERVGFAYDHEYALAVAFTAVMLYLTYREFGWTFFFVLAGAIAYGLFGSVIPGILGHGGISSTRLLLVLVLEIDGFFGFLTRLVATWIALFLLLSGLFRGYGAFDLILRFAMRTAHYIRSGVAQSAVVASMVIGSINGSQTANAGMTGSVTIPVMKEHGIRGDTAGGIESVASTSGQVLPPVMGAAAFVMASLLGIAYVDVLIAGLIPAGILVVSIAVAVHYVSVNELNFSEIDPDELIDETLPTRLLALETAKFAVPIIVLIYTLGIAQYTVMTSALYSVATMVGLGVAIPILRTVFVDDTSIRGDSPITTANGVVEQVVESFWETIQGFREGAVVAAPITIILGAINGVVDILMTSGVPSAISLALIDISGGTMIIAVLISMIVCILMGLGMPTSGAYLVVALLIAPTLITDFAVPDLAAHYFVFYAAILAGLTPPIAATAAVAAGIANADFWRTCYMSIKISAPLFILPISFIYHPEIVSAVFNTETITSAILILIGSLGIIHGLNYPFKQKSQFVTALLRVSYFGVGLVAMTVPFTVIQIGASSVIIFSYLLGHRSKVLDPVQTAGN